MGSGNDKSYDGRGPFNNIMKGLEGIFGLVDDLIVSSDSFRNISGEVDLNPQNKAKAQYGLSMKLGLDDMNSSRPSVTKMEPSVEIYEEENEYRIIILTSNIEKKDIKILTKDNQIIFEARNPEVYYYKEIVVPDTIDDQFMTWDYKNGVIEIIIRELNE